MFEAVLEEIRKADTIIIHRHKAPDGDAIGSQTVRGIRLFQNEKGFWINMPQRSYTDQNGDTKYEDYVFPVTKEAREQLHGAIMDAYDHALAEAQTETQQQQQPEPQPEQVQRM